MELKINLVAILVAVAANFILGSIWYMPLFGKAWGKEMGPLVNVLNSAIFTWLGFYVPGHLGATVWENKSWKLFAINTGYNLVSLLVVALILNYWG